MLYRIGGAILVLFGGMSILGHLLGGTPHVTAESSFAIRYNDLISGIAFFVSGLYLLVRPTSKRA